MSEYNTWWFHTINWEILEEADMAHKESQWKLRMTVLSDADNNQLSIHRKSFIAGAKLYC